MIPPVLQPVSNVSDRQLQRCDWLLPVGWLLGIGANGCLVVMAFTHLVRGALHLQARVLGCIWA